MLEGSLPGILQRQWTQEEREQPVGRKPTQEGRREAWRIESDGGDAQIQGIS